MRLHARPEADVTLAVSPSDDRIDVGGVRAALKRWPFVPLACEVVNDSLGRELGLGGEAVVFRLGGNSESVAEQRRAIAELAGGPAREVDPSVWRSLRAADDDATLVLRVSRAPAEVSAAWADATALTAPFASARVSASPARGIVRCATQAVGASIEQYASTLAGLRSRIVAERAPVHLWNAPPLARAADPLQSRIRDAFDPQRILNPGILGERAVS